MKLPSMKFIKSHFVSLIIIAILFSACETQTAFRSEKKLNKQIQAHTWKMVKLNPASYEEDWDFTNGTVYRKIYNDNGSILDVDTGTYSIDAKLSYSYLTISDFRRELDKLNARWTIVELTDDVLALAYKGSSSGLMQKEFVTK